MAGPSTMGVPRRPEPPGAPCGGAAAELELCEAGGGGGAHWARAGVPLERCLEECLGLGAARARRRARRRDVRRGHDTEGLQ